MSQNLDRRLLYWLFLLWHASQELQKGMHSAHSSPLHFLPALKCVVKSEIDAKVKNPPYIFFSCFSSVQIAGYIVIYAQTDDMSVSLFFSVWKYSLPHGTVSLANSKAILCPVHASVFYILGLFPLLFFPTFSFWLTPAFSLILFIFSWKTTKDHKLPN